MPSKNKTTKQSIIISEDILIGKIKLTETQHIDVSIVKCQGKGYLSKKKRTLKRMVKLSPRVLCGFHLQNQNIFLILLLKPLTRG